MLHTLVVHELKQHDWLQLLLQLLLHVVLQELVPQLVSQPELQLFVVVAQLLLQLSARATAGTKSAKVKNILESCFIKVLLL